MDEPTRYRFHIDLDSGRRKEDPDLEALHVATAIKIVANAIESSDTKLKKEISITSVHHVDPTASATRG